MTKETGHNNHANNWHILALKHQPSNIVTDNVTTKKTSRNNRKNYHIERTTSGKSTKLKELLKFSFQAKIDASHRSTTAENETREIQNTTIDASLSQ